MLAAFLLMPLAQPALERVVDDLMRGEGAPVASPTPEPLPDAMQTEPPAPVASSLTPGPGGTMIMPLEHGHKARALSHGSGNYICSNDCTNGPGSIGSITGDNYCDDGASSTAFCADPSGVQYPCEAAITSWCPFGHDCTDCGPRRSQQFCTCCAVRARNV
jgi:hypothetical protein